MKAVSYLKSQFSYAIKGNGRLNINQNHVDALNEIIDFVNGKSHENDVEDALMLFYLLRIWRIDNEKNKLKLSERKEISNPKLALEELFFSVKPKEAIIDEIFTEFRSHQLMNNVQKTDLIKKNDIRKLLNQLLNHVRNFKSFNLIKSKFKSYD